MRDEVTFGLQHRQVLGRRPETVRITPSKPFPWWNGDWSEGGRFTAQQQRALKRRGRNPATAQAITVRREAPDEDVWVPIGTWRPIYAFEAPLLAMEGDKARIIAPDGSEKVIRADGWAAKPSSKPVGRSAW